MKNIGFSQVNITDGLMARRQRINREVSSHAVFERFCDTGRFDPYFADASRRAPDYPKNLHIFYDSDVVKLIEGVAYMLRDGDDSELEAMIRLVEDGVERNQDPDGYFDSYFQNNAPEKRFTERGDHELYTAGHLFEAAVAVYEMTGRRRLLDCACRLADLIERVFKDEKSAKFLTPGHEEIELALVRLWRATGERRYLELSKYFVDTRGCNDVEPADKTSQSHLPARKQLTAEGHSVRACYFYSAMADIALEYGDAELADACRALFEDITRKKMFVTGGIGQTRVYEGFDRPYHLLNDSAYSETCAGIALAFFALRMQELELDSRYADVIETLLYNGILSGVSLDGSAFFYENPLELDPARYHPAEWDELGRQALRRMPILQRKKVFSCSCCPPNICRFFASVGDYAYSKDGGTYYVNQFFNGDMVDGDVRLTVETDYPNYGAIRIVAEGTRSVAVRIPGWCRSFSLDREYEMRGGYAHIAGDGEINLLLDMPVALLKADPRADADVGRAALRIGPVVYCLEGVDNGDGLKLLSVDPELDPLVTFDDSFGANVVEVNGRRELPADSLYTELGDKPEFQPVRLHYIPYFAFANRGETEMLVWVRTCAK